MPEPRRNIVMVMVDDASARTFDYLPKTNSYVVTQGATLPSYLLSQPLCAPSRATILRGQYAQNTGIDANGYDGVSALETFQANGGEASTIATWFEAAGYRTGLVGKYMNGYGEPPVGYYTPPGWDYFVSVGGDAGDAYKYWLYDNGSMVYHGNDPDTDYVTNVFRDAAVGYVQNALADEVPFLLIVTPKAPHHPAEFHEDYEGEYDGVDYPTGNQNPSWDEADVDDKPDWVRNQGLLSVEEKSAIHHFFRRKLRAMRSVDDLVEALVVAIGEQMDNTYFIFCSDNGFHSGEHRLGHGDGYGGKNSIYEEDIRVPLYIRGPGIAAQSTVGQLVGNVDIAPTLCAMADVTPDPEVILDGRSFLPLVTGQTVEWRKYYLLNRGKGQPFAGFRAEFHDPSDQLRKFTFAEFDEDQEGPQGEYYNLIADPYQLENLYLDLDPLLELQPLRDRLDDLRICEGDSCRAAEV